MKNGFSIFHETDYSICEENFRLHNHSNMHEILLFICGDSEFHVDGSLYKLNPYDIIIASNNELHRVVHHSSQKYERIVINIDTDYFVKNNCTEFSDIFENRPLGINNHIDFSQVVQNGIYDAIKKIEKYVNENQIIVARCIITELLYLLNKTVSSSGNLGYTSKHVPDIVAYINNNLTELISLNSLSNAFNLTPSYISRIFKEHIKMPFKKYVTYKRLILVRELCFNGMTLLDACMEAGFSDYSNFYRMYVKEFGHSPKKDLK